MKDHFKAAVPLGHPYYSLRGLCVYYLDFNNKWRVQWRDFSSIKHDQEFDDELAALRFYQRVAEKIEVFEGAEEAFIDAEMFWFDLVAQHDMAARPELYVSEYEHVSSEMMRQYYQPLAKRYSDAEAAE